jgi:hypothetical protein
MRFTFTRLQRMSISMVFLLLISLTAPTLAKDATGFALAFAPPEPRVTVKMENTALRTALRMVLNSAGVNFIIHPDVPYNDVAVNLKEQPLSVVLKALFKFSSKPLHYRIWNGIYRVETVPNADAKPGQFVGSGDMRVTMGLNSVPARTALILIMDQFQQSYSISPTLNQKLKDTPITIQMTMPFERAIDTLRKVAGVDFQIVPEGKMTHFLLPGEKIETRPFIKGGEAAPGEKRVTVDWSGNVGLGTALRLLMRQFKAEYALHPDLEGASLSIRMENVPLSQALAEIGKASSLPFTVRLEKGVYRLLPIKGSGSTNKTP